MLLELLGSRERKNKASSCLSLSMVCVCVCVLCLEGKHAEVPTRSQPFAWVLRGVYIVLPPGGTMVIRLGPGPSRQCLCLPASPPAAGSRWLVGPAGCRLLGRQAGPTAWVLSAAAYCSRASDDEGFVGVSMATVGRLGGYHCSLTPSCLLSGAPASWTGVAGFWRPAILLAA